MGASHTFAAVRRNEKPLTQRLLLPVAGMAVLLLGGLGFLYAMFASHREHRTEGPPAPKTQPAVVARPASHEHFESIDDEPQPSEKPAPKKVAAEQPKPPEPAPEPEAKMPPPAIELKAPDAPAMVTAPAAEKKPAGEPYMVPENKPFIDRDTFGTAKPKTPATATPAATPATPKPAPVEPAKPPPPTPATTVQNDTYVLFSGRKITAVSTIDMGDSYGIKDTAGAFIKVKKADVSNVIKP